MFSTPSTSFASVSRPSRGRDRSCHSLVVSVTVRRSSRVSSRPVAPIPASGAASTSPICSAGSAVNSGNRSVYVDAAVACASVSVRASRSSASVDASCVRGRVSRACPSRASKRSYPYERDATGGSSRVAVVPTSPSPSVSRASSPRAISVASSASSLVLLPVFRGSAFTPVRPSFVFSPHSVKFSFGNIYNRRRWPTVPQGLSLLLRALAQWAYY